MVIPCCSRYCSEASFVGCSIVVVHQKPRMGTGGRGLGLLLQDLRNDLVGVVLASDSGLMELHVHADWSLGIEDGEEALPSGLTLALPHPIGLLLQDGEERNPALICWTKIREPFRTIWLKFGKPRRHNRTRLRFGFSVNKLGTHRFYFFLSPNASCTMSCALP